MFDFSVTSQKGSHIKISRIKNGEKQVLVFPNHNEIDTDTLKAIYRQALRYISESENKKILLSRLIILPITK